MSATKVLDQAEKQGLLEPKVIAELRKQVAESKFIVTPEAIAKVLVDNEHLTPFQARKLVASALGEPPPEAEPKKTRTGPSVPDELSLADEEPGDRRFAAPATSTPEDDVVMLEVVDRPAPRPAAAPKLPAAAPKPPANPPPRPVAPKQESPRTKPPARPTPPPPPDDLVELEAVPPAAPAKPAAPTKPKPKWKPEPGPAPTPAAPSGAPAAETIELIPLTPIAPAKPAPMLTPLPPAPPAPSSPPAPPSLAPVLTPIAPVTPALTPLPPATPGAAAAPAEGLQPLDDLLVDPLTGQPDPLASSALAGAPVAPQRKVPKNVWDSPLLLIGGGVLGLILVAFFLLWYQLFRGSAAELLAKGEEDYKAGSYTSAISIYDKFLQSYANDPNVSYVRVRRGMAQLRQASDDGRNPRQGLPAAKTILPQIEAETDEFPKARLELSTLLPDIADGFATQAGEAKDRAAKEELVALTKEAMDLVNTPSYLPASLRKDREGRIAAILDKLKLAERSIEQDKDLAAALGKIAASEQQGDAAGAYKVRGDLLKLYPILEGNTDLVAAIRKVGDKERDLVKVTGDEVPAETDDPESAAVRIVLAAREGPQAAETAASIAPMQIESAVYGFDAASGRVLWRRFVGFESQVPPQRLARDELADVLVTDGRRQELVRIAAATGKLAWRQAVGESTLAPVLGGEHIFVSTSGGKVLQVDPESGAIRATATLPQGATVPAAFDSRQTRLIQPGEHSTLFVLSGQTLECIETYYLGHARGSLLVPPVSVLDYLLVPESPADDHTLIHVLTPAGENKRLGTMGQPFRLKGRVTAPLMVSGKRVAAVTDLGQIAVYEIDPANRQQPVRIIAGLEATEREPTRFATAIEGNRLWVASKRCSLYEIQSSVQNLARRWSRHQDDAFVGSLLPLGGTLVHARRRPGSPAAIVEGCVADGGQPTWTSQVAIPLAGLLSAPGRNAVDVVTRQGRVFSLGSANLSGGVVDAPAFPLAQESSGTIFPEIAVSSDGSQAVWTQAPPGRRAFAFDVAAGSPPIPLISAEIDDQTVAAAEFWGTSAVAPHKSGRVELLSLATGKPVALPFIPALSPSESPAWTRPAVLADGSGFVIGDGKQMLYRVVLKEQPRANLAAAKEQPFDQPLASNLATAGDTVYGLVKGPTGDVVIAIDPQSLTQSAKWPLSGRAQFGPEAVAGRVYVASEADGIFCMDAGQKLLWQKPLSHGPLAGPPVAVGSGELLLLYQDGTLARISAESGEELAALQLAEPLGRGAAVLDRQVLASTADGVLLVTPLP